METTRRIPLGFILIDPLLKRRDSIIGEKKKQ
jgi:hypothetical protein